MAGRTRHSTLPWAAGNETQGPGDREMGGVRGRWSMIPIRNTQREKILNGRLKPMYSTGFLKKRDGYTIRMKRQITDSLSPKQLGGNLGGPLVVILLKGEGKK